MGQKIRISKSGYNVLTETSLDNIVFDSDYDTLKYYTSGTVDLSVSESSTETTVTHNLNYVPFFVSYVIDPVFTTRYAMCPRAFSGFGGVYHYIETYADTTKLYFTCNTNSLSATLTFYYKIFRNTTGL
jgi:hypothetical protein